LARDGKIRRAHPPNATLSLRELTAALARPLSVDAAEHSLEDLLGIHAVVFASARGALSAAVGALEGEEVAVPAYTCAAVANAVVSAGKRPVYVDVDHRGLVPLEAWPVDGVVVAQDTYGFRSEVPTGRAVVRDAAHRPQLEVPPDTAVTVTSFEHSKWLSTGQGGLALTADDALARELRGRRVQPDASDGRLRHEAVTSLIRLTGRLEYHGRHRAADPFGRVLYRVGRERLAGQSESELRGEGVEASLLGPPNGSVARLMLSQISRFDEIETARAKTVELYDDLAGVGRTPEALVRYPMIADSPSKVETAFLEGGWDIRGRWFSAPLHPAGTDLEALGYERGSAPGAERLAATVINLPTHPLVSIQDARALIELALANGARPLVEETT
jgi:perosamine synthetase